MSGNPLGPSFAPAGLLGRLVQGARVAGPDRLRLLEHVTSDPRSSGLARPGGSIVVYNGAAFIRYGTTSAGVWSRIGSAGASHYKKVSVAGAAVTINEQTLDGDADYGYTIIGRVKLTTGSTFYLRPNHLTSNQVYRYLRSAGVSATAATGSGLLLGECASNEWAMFRADFWSARSPVAGNRQCLATSIDEFSGNVNQLWIWGSTWKETATKVTDLSVGTAGVIGTDSEFLMFPWR